MLGLVLLQPLLEELFFRGLVQGALLERTGSRGRAGISLANVATTVLFVLAHTFRQPLGWALAVFAPSLVFGFLRDRHASVWPAVCLHVIYNAGFFALDPR